MKTMRLSNGQTMEYIAMEKRCNYYCVVTKYGAKKYMSAIEIDSKDINAKQSKEFVSGLF